MEHEKSEGTNSLNELLTENELWMKESMQGAQSLMRAISNCLFFTEKYFEKIQNNLIYFFCKNYKEIKFNFMKNFTVSDLFERFVESPFLHEFETVNIELFSIYFNTRVELFFSVNNKFCSEIYSKKIKKCIKIFRINANNYSAVFKEKIKPISIFCQNFVLGLVEKSLNSQADCFLPRNNEEFINFDMEIRKQMSFQIKKSNDASKEKRYFFPFADQSIQSQKRRVLEEKTEAANSVGIDLVENIHKRKHNSVNDGSENEVNFIDNFINPLKFVENSQNDYTTSNDTINQNREDSLERYVKKYYQENKKLAVEVKFEFLESFFESYDSNSKQKDFFESFGVEKLSQHSKSHADDKEKRDKSNHIVQSSGNVEKNIVDNNSEFDTNLSEIGQKKKAKLKFSKEFIPKTKIDGNSEIGDVPLKSNFSASYSIQDYYPNCNHSDRQSVTSDMKMKDRYIETIDAILYEGRLKFFDEKHGFGFMLLTENNITQDLFVYKNEFERAKVPIDQLRQVKNGLILNFTFQIARYTTKGQLCKKAINIRLIK